ncbi:hypothetical protein RJ639_026344 [Escallonia herrerae]|uniref:SHSP domain-containing protein n=1 Tax=Escallonia herrerae TaxID=1293975 RepID=A0AA89ABN8_9ASTE|nr:hypothetical protein RJ639_026344 [Escallonia herrerae]
MAMSPRVRGVSPIPPQARLRRVYEDFRPTSERNQQEEFDLLSVFLPGFTKENLRVTTEGQNTVRVRGESPVAGNRWSRFQEDFQAPENCNMSGVRAKFESGILTITMPRKTTDTQVAPKVDAKTEPPSTPYVGAGTGTPKQRDEKKPSGSETKEKAIKKTEGRESTRHEKGRDFEAKAKETTSGGYEGESSKKTVNGIPCGANEERQLMVNIGAAVLIHRNKWKTVKMTKQFNDLADEGPKELPVLLSLSSASSAEMSDSSTAVFVRSGGGINSSNSTNSSIGASAIPFPFSHESLSSSPSSGTLIFFSRPFSFCVSLDPLDTKFSTLVSMSKTLERKGAEP